MAATAEGALAVSFETGRRYHVHKSYPLLTSVKAELALIVAVLWANVGSIVSITRGIEGLPLPVVIAGSVVVIVLVFGALFGVGMLAWRNMSFAFDEREFTYHQGIIVKKRAHVPYERVQSVNHKATLFQRLFGLCTVTIDTAGGSANKAIGVPYVTLGIAERLRTDLFARKVALTQGIPVRFDPAQAAEGGAVVGAQALFGGNAGARDASPASPDALAAQQAARAEAPNALDSMAADAVDFRGAFAGQRFGEEPVSYECGLTNGQLLLASLTDAEAIVAGLITTVVLATTFGFGVSAALGWPAASAVVVVPAAVGVLVIGFLTGIVPKVLSLGGFRARRRGSRIEVEQGLAQRMFSGVDIERVQFISVRQSFFRRLIGFCEVSVGRIDAVSTDDPKGSGSRATGRLVVHPFARTRQVDAILAGLAPEFAELPRYSERLGGADDRAPGTAPRRLPSVALRRAVVRRCVWRNAWIAVLAAAAAGAWIAVQATAGMYGSDMVERIMRSGMLALAALCVLGTATRAAGAILWQKGSRFTWGNTAVMLLNSGFSTDWTVIPRQKVQSASARTNPFQRAAGVASVALATAAGSHLTVVGMWDWRRDQAEALTAWLRPGNKALRPPA